MMNLSDVRRKFASKKHRNKRRSTIAPEDVQNNFQVVEAYKSIRTNFQFAMSTHENKIVAVTSAEPAAGKSTTLANLAAALGQAGHRVLLLDGDLRKPTQHRIFKVPNAAGLSDVLGGLCDVEKALQKDVMTNVDLISTGTIPPNPSELLGGETMRALLAKMRPEYDYVLLDTPPIGVVSDALTLLPSIAGIMLVVRQDQTTYDDLQLSIDAVTQNGGTVLGVVVSNVDNESRAYSSYRRRRYYDYRFSYYGTNPSGDAAKTHSNGKGA